MMSNCYFMVYVDILSIQDYKVHWSSGGVTCVHELSIRYVGFIVE